LFGVPLVTRTAIDGTLAQGSEGGMLSGLFSGIAAGHSPAAALLAAAAAVVLLTAAAGSLLYLKGRWAASASEAIIRGVRNRLYAHLERLPCAFHDRADTGDVVQRCTSDVETIRVFLVGQVVEIGRTALLVLTVIPIMLSLDSRMTVVSLALFPVILTFAVAFFRRVQGLFLQSDEAEGEMTAVLQENLTGIRVVRAFARQDYERGKFGERNAVFRDRTRRLITFLGAYWATSDLLCFLQLGTTLIYGAWWMQQGNMTVGTFFAFLSYQAIVIWPVRHLGRVLTDTGKAMVALGRLREILEEPVEEDAPAGAEAPPESLHGAIEVDGLTFAHRDGEPVLRDLSFRVQPGQTLALLGPPGSGKSTVIQLLLRLYDHKQGTIRLDGRDLLTLPRSFVRGQIGVVLQQPFLYSRTVEANVRVGRAEATREEVTESAAAACIHGSIEGFERGYDTLIGERGVTLSGGQRQRLAIARALLKDPAILVLDDSLSAVDTRTEARILDALRQRRHRKTTILIAHRLSSILHADRILVLEEGRIAQSGTHHELVKQPGPYRRLWRIQNDLEDEIDSNREPAVVPPGAPRTAGLEPAGMEGDE
ncbi:MAG TPA: ABC transporter ATP-binding protein, partial [bacterium]|nr:ABC transporter ATP-binding protein [bacterium]